MKLDSTAPHLRTNGSANLGRVSFSIGDESKLISILRSRLYNFPIRTLVQEYITNARDAHREKGCPNRPIVIGLPYTSSTVNNMIFSVRDFGPGLSHQRIVDVFSQFGKSTKDKSNSEHGGFGLGAKSAFAYTDNFVIVSFIGGIKTSYVAHTGSSTEGAIDKISSESTLEEDGVEIQIPLNRTADIQDFVSAAMRATMLWDIRPIINMHESHNQLLLDYDLIAKSKEEDGSFSLNLIGCKNIFNTKIPHFFSTGENVVINFDGIPYPVSDFLRQMDFLLRSEQDENEKASLSSFKLFLETDFRKVCVNYSSNLNKQANYFRATFINAFPGDINVTPSRETVIIDEKFQNFIKKIAKEFRSHLNKTTDIFANSIRSIEDTAFRITELNAEGQLTDPIFLGSIQSDLKKSINYLDSLFQIYREPLKIIGVQLRHIALAPNISLDTSVSPFALFNLLIINGDDERRYKNKRSSLYLVIKIKNLTFNDLKEITKEESKVCLKDINFRLKSSCKEAIKKLKEKRYSLISTPLDADKLKAGVTSFYHDSRIANTTLTKTLESAETKDVKTLWDELVVLGLAKTVPLLSVIAPPRQPAPRKKKDKNKLDFCTFIPIFRPNADEQIQWSTNIRKASDYKKKNIVILLKNEIKTELDLHKHALITRHMMGDFFEVVDEETEKNLRDFRFDDGTQLNVKSANLENTFKELVVERSNGGNSVIFESPINETDGFRVYLSSLFLNFFKKNEVKVGGIKLPENYIPGYLVQAMMITLDHKSKGIISQSMTDKDIENLRKLVSVVRNTPMFLDDILRSFPVIGDIRPSLKLADDFEEKFDHLLKNFLSNIETKFSINYLSKARGLSYLSSGQQDSALMAAITAWRDFPHSGLG